MKLLIAGSRSITDSDISLYIPKGTDLIICGGARGVDTLSEQYADKMKISKYVLRPNYNLYQRDTPKSQSANIFSPARPPLTWCYITVKVGMLKYGFPACINCDILS